MIGTTELILILIVALFLFGSNKLPELARSLGKAAGEFKKTRIETEHQLKGNEKSNEKDKKIHNMAIELGLEAQNKNSEQLVEEIRSRVKSNGGLRKTGV